MFRFIDSSTGGFPTRLLGFSVVLTLASLLYLGIITYGSHRTLEDNIHAAKLENRLADLNEGIENSIVMALSTGDGKWVDQYNKLRPKIIVTIENLFALRGDIYMESTIAMMSEANRRLVAIEVGSFKLVREGKLSLARAVLGGDRYKRQKVVYTNSVDKFSATLHKSLTGKAVAELRKSFYFSIKVAVGIISLVLMWIFTISCLIKWNRNTCRVIEDASNVISQKNKLLKIALENEEAANIAKSELLANISNTMRDSVRDIADCAKSLLDSTLSASQYKNLEIVWHSCESLMRNVSDVYDYSKITARKLKLESVGFDIKVNIELACRNLGVLAREKGLELNLSLVGDVPPYVIGDPLRLRQVLMILGGNAIKFTQKGSVNIILNAKASGKKHTAYCLNVKDTGVGMDACHQKSIFNRFHKKGDLLAKQYGGTGLGLAICKELAVLMGGEVGVKSTLNKGSNFWITFTLKRNLEVLGDFKVGRDKIQAVKRGLDDGASKITTVCASAVGHIDQRSLARVLVVEDNNVNKKIIEPMLKKCGCEMEWSNNGQEAYNRIKQGEEFDVIFMDCQMAVMDGFETTSLIRRYEDENKKLGVPIVACTSNDSSEDKKRCFEVGMSDFIAKPISLNSLKNIICKWLPARVGMSKLI